MQVFAFAVYECGIFKVEAVKLLYLYKIFFFIFFWRLKPLTCVCIYGKYICIDIPSSSSIYRNTHIGAHNSEPHVT